MENIIIINGTTTVWNFLRDSVMTFTFVVLSVVVSEDADDNIEGWLVILDSSVKDENDSVELPESSVEVRDDRHT